MKRIISWFNTPSPQNYLIRYPYRGALISVFFCFVFLVLYVPFEMSPYNYRLGFKTSMAIYSFAMVIPQISIVTLLKKIRFFTSVKEWDLFKEMIMVMIVLLGTGIFIYFMGFLVEGAENRLNFISLFSSLKIVFLLGFALYGFFTALNYRHWISTNQELDSLPPQEDRIHIDSRLKKEELSFWPSQFVFATSDGNYVVFYFQRNGSIQKQMVRNSITDIENQLDGIPGIFRTHRAFIVNLKKVKAKKGNALGYKLQLEGIKEEIPVARNKTQAFNKLIKQFL